MEECCIIWCMGRTKGSTNLTGVEKKLAVCKAQHPMRRGDWLKNHEKMRQALFQHWANHQKYPTDEEMSQLTGLSVRTIQKHWREYDPDEMAAIVREESSLMARQVIFGAYNGAMKGNQEDIKIILKLGANIDFNKKEVALEDLVDNVKVDESKADEQTITFEQKVLKITRRMKRDKELGLAEGEVVDADTN